MRAGFHATVKDGQGFNVVFSTNDAARPFVIVTLDAMTSVMALGMDGGRRTLVPLANAPLYRQLDQLGVPFSDMQRGVHYLAGCAEAFRRGAGLERTHASLEDWKADYTRRYKRPAPEPARLGLGHSANRLTALRQQDDRASRSFGGPRRFTHG